MRHGFTLVEVALAIAVLVVGLAAVTSIYMAGLRWVGETRQQYTALHAARCALYSPELLLDRPSGDPISGHRVDDEVSGWYNTYFCIRTVTGRKTLVDDNGWQDVEVAVYSGGDQSSGDLVYTLESGVLLLGRHAE